MRYGNAKTLKRRSKMTRNPEMGAAKIEGQRWWGPFSQDQPDQNRQERADV
jgi:hypothetical protein